ncbi:MAG: TIGR01841 family phasin [Alphaproteobacteria bacterium]|jgi:phasin family protein|nr:TIGR01841 family phasin [Alphaproteobacteria bacterium]
MANQPNPFWDMDISKVMGDMKLPGVDLEALMASQRKNIEALTAANKLAFEGFQAVATRQTEILRQTMEELQKMMTEVMSASSPEDRVAKQADLAKTAFEKALSNMKEVAEMVTKSNTEATNVISNRITDSLEELKAMAEKKG